MILCLCFHKFAETYSPFEEIMAISRHFVRLSFDIGCKGTGWNPGWSLSRPCFEFYLQKTWFELSSGDFVIEFFFQCCLCLVLVIILVMIILEVIGSVLDKRGENNIENNNIMLTVMGMAFWMLLIRIYLIDSFSIPIK